MIGEVGGGGTPVDKTRCVILVDNSKIFIEGQKYSASVKDVKKASPNDRDPCDPSWRVDFGGLLASLAEGRTIQAAVLVGSRPRSTIACGRRQDDRDSP
jgi:hypothetical protein